MNAPLGKVAVLGVGLIGGSFAAAVRKGGLAREVVGFGPPADSKQALERGLIDAAASSVAEAVGHADLVMLAAPIPALAELLRTMAPHLPAQAIVSDCASTKCSVLRAAERYLADRGARFVAGHPIAGSEKSGPMAARADLFEGCQVMICPTGATDAGALARVEALWGDLGSTVVRMDATAHDRLYGELSHWPHAVAFALSAAVASGTHADDALRFAGAGLRDTTRIGASSPELWADIMLDNRAVVLESARAFLHQVDALVDALDHGRREELIDRLKTGSHWRRKVGP